MTHKIVISGVCGTIGSALLKSLAKKQPDAQIIGFDNNENGVFALSSAYRENEHVNCILGDLRDNKQMLSVTEEADLVYHIAARKHVGVCEYSPDEAISTNVGGLQNIINACESNLVSKFLFTSSDKAVNPTNVMGTTKLLGEKLVTSAHYRNKGKNLRFASTRFGNVMGSNGSVIPIFAKACFQENPIPITSPEMTRFMMSMDESVELIISASDKMIGGEIFITKMPCVNILTLAQAVFSIVNKYSSDFDVSASSFKINELGIRQGEKLYEELMNTEELARSFDDNKFIIIKPAFDFNSGNISGKEMPIDRVYNSSIEHQLSLEDTIKLIEYLPFKSYQSAQNEYSWP